MQKRIVTRGPTIPLMFTLVADGLNKIIRKAEGVGIIEGLKASKRVKVTDLQ